MPIPSQKPFMLAVDAYQAKRYKDARKICRKVLRDAPDHVGCLYLCGAAEFGLGRPAEAEPLMRRALALNPAFPEIHYGYAQVLMALGKYTEAIAACQRTLEIKPQHFEACYVMGNAHKSLGQSVQAEQAYKQAVSLKPDYPEAFNSLGILFYEQGKIGDAIKHFEHALTVRPDFPEALNNLGAAYIETKEFLKAVESCKRAIALQPDYAAAFNNMGNALRAQEQWDDARRCYEQALELAPDNIEARNNLGLVFLDGYSDLDAAAVCFRYILMRVPDHVGALTHLGIVFCQKGDFAEGSNYYKKALALQPDYRDAINNLGNALHALGDTAEAIACYERILVKQPNDHEVRKNMAMSLLMLGRFDKGWQDYECRWQTSQLAAARREFEQPQWRGEDSTGKTLLIHAEQGFGDTLQFCRYASLAAARGIKVVLEVQPELVRLMNSLVGVETVIGRGESLPSFDLHCPMMSLPFAFGTQIETIPAKTPYLSAPSEGVTKWQKRLGDKKRFRVGLIWAGNPRLFSPDLAAANRRRSMPPERLAPLIELENIDFYSLQKDGPTPPAEFSLIDCMPECKDFSDTAALIANLDIVIGVDTAGAHLAAAIGKPVWLLNRYDTCWRWFRSRNDSPWYPKMRLFRQLRPGDWDSVIDMVSGELERIESESREASY